MLGGGSEIGASCLFVKMADTNILIDAGMRVHGDDLLPSLGMLERLGRPDVILVTHAHADHIGALPIVHSLHPDVPLYATPPTCDLMRVMMKDSYKIMEMRSRQMNTLPLYTEEQVNTVLSDLLQFPASNTLTIGNVKITTFRAGHILGAVMFLLEAEGESLLVTGDISFKAGRTIPGAVVPHSINPDVVIMESTYGNRVHTDRNHEERLLADHVAEVVAGGGFALIPAFALGRAQEVMLILQDYMERGLIPEFPIFVDGLVTPISRIYRDYPHYLKGPVAHRINRNGDAFLTERCRAVQPKEREMILQGKPGCIVASSGMLTGGASAWYAERLVSGEKNAIFITGYQDEESPGRKLLNLAEGLEETIELHGISIPVKCRIGKYGLSAHADANEINRFIEALNPTYTFLVHGDDEARMQLSGVLNPRHKPILVENGQTYPFEKRNSGKGVKGKRYNADKNRSNLQEKVGSVLLFRPEGENVLKAALCTGVHPKSNILFCQSIKGKSLKLQGNQVAEAIGPWNGPFAELASTMQEVLAFSRPYASGLEWSGMPPGSYTIGQIYRSLGIEGLKQKAAAALLLQGIPEGSKKEGDTGPEYVLTDNLLKKLSLLDLPAQGLKMNPAGAMEEVRSLLADHRGFLRCGVEGLGTSGEKMILHFDFPDLLNQTERIRLAGLVKERTGWNIAISDSVRQDLLQEVLRRLLGRPVGSVSIHLGERKVAAPVEAPENGADIAREFLAATGFKLQFKGETGKASMPAGDAIFHVEAGARRMENNQAIEEAKKWADERGITIYKTSMKQQGANPLMEVHFISPEVALRHEADLEELSYRIGMPVTYAKNPKQNEIIAATLSLLPGGWDLKKNPSIHMDRKLVAVKLANSPEAGEVEQVRAKLEELTGYGLEVG